MKLNQEQIRESIGRLKKAFNGDVIEVFNDLAVVLKEEKQNGDNSVVDQAYEQCKKVQNIYNPCVESMAGFFRDAEGVAEIAEYLEKQADMGEVGSHDASFANQGIDADAARI